MKIGVFIPCIWALMVIKVSAEATEPNSEEESTEVEPLHMTEVPPGDAAPKAAIELDNGYIFTCPRSMEAGATNQMQLQRFGSTYPAGYLNVTVKYTSNGNESVAAQKHYTVDEDVRFVVMDLAIDKFEEYVYNGQIEINGSFGGHEIQGSDKVYFRNSKEGIVLIQTDKPLYKKGQTVLFRVLSLDRSLKPSSKVANISVEDPGYNRLFQWTDEDIPKGMKQFEFPLSDEPMLGEWRIIVEINGEPTTTLFEVKEYVLPKFEVTIQPPTYVLASAEEFPITVCAKYTYGKAVEGDLSMNISMETYTWSSEKVPILEIEEKIKGCFVYNVNVSLIDATDRYYSYRRIQISASVEEAGTGINRSATHFLQRQFVPLNMDFKHEQRQYFKPGLPYNGLLAVTNPDKTPAGNEDVELCYTVERERILSTWWATKKTKVCKNFTSDDSGVVEFIIPPQSTDTVRLNVDATSLKYQKKAKGTREDSMTTPTAGMSLTPWFSPSGNFVQLQPVQETLSCGSERTFKLLFTSKESQSLKFQYQVLSQGRVVGTGEIQQSFTLPDDDVSSRFKDETKVISGEMVQISPPLDSSKMVSEKEECPILKETKYVPPLGEAQFTVEIDPMLSPSFYVLVFSIRDDRETIADSQKFKVEECFKNQVKLQFGDAEKQPGTRTTVRVTASPESLCGIQVVDKGVSLLNSNEQLTKEKVFRILESFDNGMYGGTNHCNDDVPQPGLFRSSYPKRPQRPWTSSSYDDSLAAFENAGFVVISDLTLFTRPCKSGQYGGHVPVAMEHVAFSGQAMPLASAARQPASSGNDAGMKVNMKKKVGVDATKSVEEVRSYFPDTWLFRLETIGEDGEFLTKEKLPHTITEWVGSAVCLQEEDGLGISNKTTIKGFQAFFVSLELPFSVVRSEKFEVTLSVSNYVQDPMPIKVSLEQLDGFSLVDGDVSREICVEPDSTTTLKLKLQALELGDRNLTVGAETAESSQACGDRKTSDKLAKDAVQRSILVKAEGWPEENVKSKLICVTDNAEAVKEEFELLLPEEHLVPDSGRAYVDVSGNILGKSLDNLDRLVTIPTGCGEQNLVKLAPNLVALEVLEATGTLTEKMRNKITRNLITGVQQQKKYMRSDGSFSAFGDRSKEGSMFLTAFVLKVFSKAAKYVTIDSMLLQRAQRWILLKQGSDGCFPIVGQIFNKAIQGGVGQGNGLVPITAYVTAALLQSGYKNTTILDKAFSCLQSNENDSVYANLLVAYAEALSPKMEAARERLASVEDKAIREGGTKRFQDQNATKSTQIETTAYAVITSLLTGATAKDVNPLIQFLVKNLNSRGGFYSTQDTCVGFEALGAFAKLTMKEPLHLNLNLRSGSKMDEGLELDESNKLLVQRSRLPEVPSTLQVTATGSGCALVQTVLRYNRDTPLETRSFDLGAQGECLDEECRTASITVATHYVLNGQAGMSVIEVEMITGYSPLTSSLDKLLKDEALKLMRADVVDNKAVLYFNEITNVPKVLTLEVENVFGVENPQPGKVKIYDYYNRDVTSNAPYVLGKCNNKSCPGEQ